MEDKLKFSKTVDENIVNKKKEWTVSSHSVKLQFVIKNVADKTIINWLEEEN